jgi:diamine N-acetyltransferase
VSAFAAEENRHVFKIRNAAPADLAEIVSMIRELADYERLLHEVDATDGMINGALFGPQPRVFCEVAEWVANGHGAKVGFALWFYSFSTFRGRHGIYLEDLFVRPSHRGLGIGKALLARLAARCVREGLTRLEWAVLDWNAPALEFYKVLGARVLNEWRTHRLSGDALAALAAESGTI